jgi:hypothetical protein
MEIIRERHTRTKEELKQLLIGLIHENGLEPVIRWSGFAFEGKAKGTIIKGEIFDNEMYVEIIGWFEKLVVQQLRQSWQELVTLGRV